MRHTFAFIHVERTGGTTIQRRLQSALAGYHSMHPWALYANEPESATTPGELFDLIRLTRVRGIGGHGLRTWDFLWAGVSPVFALVMREPRARFLSHFHYQRSVRHLDWSLRQFCAERRFWDWQTVRLAGYRDLARAQSELNKVHALGFQHDLDGFAATLLGARLPSLPRRNAVTGGGTDAWHRLTAAEQRMVERANSLDLELWAFAMEQGTRVDVPHLRTRQRPADGRSISRATFAFAEAIAHRRHSSRRPAELTDIIMRRSRDISMYE
jgi:hypothetical protein